jgi:NitT/TauT family transport system permease protein
MTTTRNLGIAALALMTAGLIAPMGEASWMANTSAFGFALAACVAAAWCLRALSTTMRHAIAIGGLLCGVAATLYLLGSSAVFGTQAIGLWLFVAGWALFLWRELDALAHVPARGVTALAAPVLFGLALLFLWQVLVIGFAVPKVLLPSPGQVAIVLGSRGDILWPDFRQTFLKAVIAGYVIGNGAGFLAAMVTDRIPWLKRGVLPLCNLSSAMPIVGIAPIMVMWFGFDWESKAAVVAIITFFPMLVNTLAGLDSVDNMQRDLMRSYAATPGQAFSRLRLPTALPFVFNALKVNSTLALIAAIVAEFFGSPILGLGFRISTEVARLNVDVVWAVIAIAALAGSIFYGVVAAIERVLTFWHPSYRS